MLCLTTFLICWLFFPPSFDLAFFLSYLILSQCLPIIFYPINSLYWKPYCRSVRLWMPMKKQLQFAKIQSKWDKNHIIEMQLTNSVRRCCSHRWRIDEAYTHIHIYTTSCSLSILTELNVKRLIKISVYDEQWHEWTIGRTPFHIWQTNKSVNHISSKSRFSESKATIKQERENVNTFERKNKNGQNE